MPATATKNDQQITLDIATPKGTYVHDFDKNAKVDDVIRAAITAMGLQSGERFELVLDDQILQPERPLVSYRLQDGVKLVLAATGSGV